MLVEFSCKNFRSFKDLETISLVASNTTSKYKAVDTNNVFEVDEKLRLLKSKAVYGANASGKSNLVKAMSAMLYIIQRSLSDDNIIGKYVVPFRLSTETENEPTFFQIIFVLNQKMYRYGFEIYKKKIISEWLFGTANKNEVYFFKREGQQIEINENQFSEGKKLVSQSIEDSPLYRENSLFLSLSAALNGKIASDIFDFIKNKIGIIVGLKDDKLRRIAIKRLSDEKAQKRMVEFLKVADLGIKDVFRVEFTDDTIPEDVTDDFREKALKISEKGLILTHHSIYNNNGETLNQVEHLSLDRDESEGTQKMFVLSPFIFDALDNGITLVVDEFDARLHPRLTRKILELFNSNETNPNNAQLIFITHDTNLLDARLMRQDQICFVEKDKFEASHIYSLVEIKGVRNDASYEKDYMKGKYGAVPYLGKFNLFFEPEHEDAETR